VWSFSGAVSFFLVTETGKEFISILWMRKQRPKEVKALVQGHVA
jgi:hypothetical protein